MAIEQGYDPWSGMRNVWERVQKVPSPSKSVEQQKRNSKKEIKKETAKKLIEFKEASLVYSNDDGIQDKLKWVKKILWKPWDDSGRTFAFTWKINAKVWEQDIQVKWVAEAFTSSPRKVDKWSTDTDRIDYGEVIVSTPLWTKEFWLATVKADVWVGVWGLWALWMDEIQNSRHKEIWIKPNRSKYTNERWVSPILAWDVQGRVPVKKITDSVKLDLIAWAWWQIAENKYGKSRVYAELWGELDIKNTVKIKGGYRAENTQLPKSKVISNRNAPTDNTSHIFAEWEVTIPKTNVSLTANVQVWSAGSQKNETVTNLWLKIKL